MMLQTARLFALVLAILIAPSGLAQGLGMFIGTVKAEWIHDRDGRSMILLESFAYIDPSGTRWDAPAGSIIDGASIPKFAWSFIGGPYEGLYREASVIHDVACQRKERPWPDVHRAFYMAMLASKVNEIKAKTMYAAVYQFGPRWERRVSLRDIPVIAVNGTIHNLQSAASPGEIIETQVSPIPRRGCPEGIICATPIDLPPNAANVDAVFRPSPPTLGINDFEKLKSLIETTNPPLSVIENYRPSQP
jgi:hypothetical protein